MAGNIAVGFLKLIAKHCKPPGQVGIDNPKRLAVGRLPRGVPVWPCEAITDAPTVKRIRAQPLSAFATQVLEDHPGLSVAEAKVP